MYIYQYAHYVFYEGKDVKPPLRDVLELNCD